MLKRNAPPARLIALADKARDRHEWSKASAFYAKALEQEDQRADIWVQYGHAQKESGFIADALTSYFRAATIDPNDPDVYLQIGHAYKISGDFVQAASAYAKSVERKPDHNDAKHELQALQARGIASDLTISSILQKPATLQADNDALSLVSIDKPEINFTIVGRLGNENSIQMLTNAFLETLSTLNKQLQVINTRPNESVNSYISTLKTQRLSTEADALPSMVSVYCDVIANHPDDDNYLKVPPSVVRYAYAVFDSNRLPEFWVRRLNAFDGVLVTDECLVPVMHRSGVYRPVFVLPLALDYDNLLRVESSSLAKDDVITFGCIASFSIRKNIRTLIDAFLNAFGDNDKVRLRIHSPLNFSNHFDQILEYLAHCRSTNVIITCSALSRKEYAHLLSTFDVYVNVSKGEGFSITPREALFLGIPTILSDNTAHKVINRTGLTLSIRTQRYEPAFYEGLGGENFGYQCCPDATQLRHSLSKMLSHLPVLKGKSAQMRRFAESYSIDSLRWRYRSLAQPKDVFMGKENAIFDSHIVTTDCNLYDRITEVRRRLKSSVPESARQRITVMGHDGGFFSLFNTFVSYLVWNIGRPDVTSIVPDWRVSEMQHYRKLNKFTSFCYGKRMDGNLWLQFFHPIPEQDAEKNDYNDHHFLSEAVVYDRFNEENEPFLTYVNAYTLYKSSGFAAWRKWYGAYVAKYIRFQERLTSQADLFEVENFDSKLMIGCHVRHPSHSSEQPGGKLPTVELFQQLIVERVNGIKDWKVFLATDQQSVIDAFLKVFGRRVIYRSNIARVQEQHDNLYNALSSDEKSKEGHQIQHLTASDEAKWSTSMGDEVIVDALLLARCHCFVHVTSNIATAVSFLNPEIEMIYCE